MASIHVSNSCNSTNASGSNMYRVGDYVYFEAQQQQQSGLHQPFQIRRIEELNKTANGNIEAKVMCFYRRRDLPVQLVALADKHQQHQLSLTLSLSPGENIAKDSGKQTIAMKTQVVTDKNIPSDKKELQQTFVEEQVGSKLEITELTDSIKEEEKQNVTEAMETDLVASTVKSAGDALEDEKYDVNDKNNGKEDEKTIKFTQHDWWRGEQLKQRELFLSRQVETLVATQIRGKCTVTLYNETESLDSYLEREDTFFYCLVFDPVQKTLLADKGEIRVGNKYQAEVPPKALYNYDISKDFTTVIKKEGLCSGENDELIEIESNRDDIKPSTTVKTINTFVNTVESDSDFETLIWTCNPRWNSLTDRQIDQFLVVSRSLGTFARALDCTSSVKQPSLHMSAAAASRDITLFHAMDTLHMHGYDLGKAICSLVPSTGPVLCRDEMEEWSASEANLFEESLEKYGKDFADIRHDFLPWKTHKNIVEYYYMWKTTDRYVQQKRVKAVEQESKLKQVYIPYNGTLKNCGKQQTLTSAVMIKSSQLVNGNSAVELYSKNNGGLSTDGQLLSGVCDLCDVVVSQQWYPNTMETTSISYHQQNGIVSSTLCHTCWTHWKKYGGPRTGTSDKKVMGGKGDNISEDEDRLLSNTSFGSAMNLNVFPSNRPSAQMQTQLSTQHHLMHHSNFHNTGSLLLQQPHIHSSGLSTAVQRCNFIGCQAPPYKNKSQLLRHYSAVHGIGINSNNSNSTPIITSSNSGKLSSPPPMQQQAMGLHHNSSGPLNLNNSNNSIPQCSIVSGDINQIINFIVAPQPNLPSVSTNSAIGTVAVTTATGRPVMKTRTAFYLRCTSLTKASRRRAVHKAISALIQNHQQKFSSNNIILSPISMTSVQSNLARPRNVARRPFVCIPQAAHTYKHECMLSMQNAPIHELRAYLRAAAVKTHARRPGVTRVANTLIAARKGRETVPTDIIVPEWLSLPSQHSAHHISSGTSKQGKHSSRSSIGRVAFPKPPKAPDGSLLYERVPNKEEAAAIGLNPTAAAILGALGQTGSINTNSASGSLSDPSAVGFDVAATICRQQGGSNNKRRLYDSDNGNLQPKPQVGPPSKRIHKQQQQPQGGNAISGVAVDNMLATLVAHQQHRIGPVQLNKSGNQPQQNYRTPSMARTGRKHVISWTDAPDDLYYRCTTLSKSLRKARMTGKELRRSARKPWFPIAALLGISFTMPSSSTAPLIQIPTTGLHTTQQSSVALPYDMSTNNSCAGNSNKQLLSQPATIIVSSRNSGNISHH